ncbi:MAG: hypothetical protein LBU23_01015 [Planctomycetota bacterium]|nr:hypothetical protein [Planctomycetota bacterium]
MTKEPLSPKIDVVFKSLMLESGRLARLASFLSGVLQLPEDELREIAVADPNFRGDAPNVLKKNEDDVKTAQESGGKKSARGVFN